MNLLVVGGKTLKPGRRAAMQYLARVFTIRCCLALQITI